MKYIALLLLVGCTPAVREDKPKVDLAVLVAEAMADKPVVYIEKPQNSKRVVQLCKRVTPGAYDDSALEEAVRVMQANKQVIENCANKQLKDIAKEYGLEVRE